MCISVEVYNACTHNGTETCALLIADVAAWVTMQLVQVASLTANHTSYHCSRLKVGVFNDNHTVV